jgi:hypothetical protein
MDTNIFNKRFGLTLKLEKSIYTWAWDYPAKKKFETVCLYAIWYVVNHTIFAPYEENPMYLYNTFESDFDYNNTLFHSYWVAADYICQNIG